MSGRLERLAAFERDAVIVACAVSAGIHGALTPAHLAESSEAGLGFAASTAALAVVAAALGGQRPASAVVPAAAAGILTGLLVSYAFAATVGLPLLHPEPEPVDGLAVFTKAIEAAGLLAAAHLLWHRRSALVLTLPRPKGSCHEYPHLPADSPRADDADRAG